MSVERNLIISLLKLTKKGAVLTENVNKDARILSATSTKLLDKLQNEGLVNLESGEITADSNARLKLAVKAVSLGADSEQTSHLLCWQEFEEIAGFALKTFGYTVANNIRFKNATRRYEIDVIGCKKPAVICVDCKHWQHSIAPSALRRIVDSQVERTNALVDILPNIKLTLECTKWSSAKFIPVVLSLFPGSFKFYDNVPIVPILQLQDFINQMPLYVESLRYFTKSFSSLSHNF